MDKLRALYDMYINKYFSSSEITGNTLAFIELTSILFQLNCASIYFGCICSDSDPSSSSTTIDHHSNDFW
jgi:hypothetical protein